MTETGVVHGRFQIFHLDHLKYLLAAKQRCRHLVIGITNPDPTLTRTDPADPKRSLPQSNPLTYFERYTIIREVMAERGLLPAEFSIVPFPINIPELYRFYLPLDALFFLTIYDDWGRRKHEMFKSLGLNVEVLWERAIEQKGIRATEVRRRIAEGLEWEHLLPAAAVSVMKKLGIPERIAGLKS
ncbi:MAG: nicotinate-nucleotide adenylyltransferase [Syntrophobacteraceae bacterium]|nr:nicotinate-nucleotide adenylyltransferase [Syntrophobacteraceae bacterium]